MSTVCKGLVLSPGQSGSNQLTAVAPAVHQPSPLSLPVPDGSMTYTLKQTGHSLLCCGTSRVFPYAFVEMSASARDLSSSRAGMGAQH